MAKSHNQKIKILILQDLLCRTREHDVVTMQEILEKLGEYGISAERKSIYDDMEALREFGYDIQYKRGRTGGYYLRTAPDNSSCMPEEPELTETECEAQPEETLPEQTECREEPAAASAGEWQVCREEIGNSGKTMKLMYSREKEEAVRHYFGSLGEYKEKAPGYLTAVVPQVAGPQFFGWLTSMGREVHIVKPKKTAAAYRDYLKNLAKEYKRL